MKKLREKSNLYVFSKEAVSVRGIPDIVGCYNGTYFALEVKKAKSEVYNKYGIMKDKGRIVLQKYNIQKTIECGGFASFIYPENMNEVLEKLFKT